MERVAIFGAGGLGSMVLDTLHQARHFQPIAFLDSDENLWGRFSGGLPIVGGLDELETLRRNGVRGAIVAIGDNAVRAQIAGQIVERGLRLISAIHPLASISPTATLHEHLIIGARATICVHAQIGAHAVISPGVIIEHDNVIGTGAFLHPAVRLAGTVTVGDGATLGIGACVIPGRTVGAGAQVEPGAVVIRDVPAGAQVGGAPATLRGVASGFVAQESDAFSAAQTI